MSRFVRIPRAKFADYCHRPWNELVAAAEDHEDGLNAELPAIDGAWPYCVEGPQRSAYREGIEGDELFRKANEKYERGNNAAYMREGDGSWGKNKACLYQQCW